MNTVFIIPTGIGCKIGGHAGDATPAFKGPKLPFNGVKIKKA